jgi:hypothetical protein
LDSVRGVADAVLYEGYLLYPYRSTSSKNSVRWQFGVLAPPDAASVIGEESGMSTSCLLRPAAEAAVEVYVRCLQLQARGVERAVGDGGFVPVAELDVDGTPWLSWDEAVDREVAYGPVRLADLGEEATLALAVGGGEDVELLRDASGAVVGRVVRRRARLQGDLRLSARSDGDLVALSVAVDNTTASTATREEATRHSFIGAHVMLVASDAAFVSMIDPPTDASQAAARCEQHRCWPVLAGSPGDTDVVLGLPIILYDYPEVAPQSAGALFDATEIDEILTLRVMTLTEQEKAEARATDAHAAAIIDRCDSMTPEQMQALHGILRDPHAGAEPAGASLTATPSATLPSGDEWWATEAAADVSPETDSVLVSGVPVAKGSLVRLHPSRRADAQDLFFADQVARVSGVHVDLDGTTHVAVTLLDDPAAEMHDWYGRYLYFAPDELEPLVGAAGADQREETTS